MDALDGFTTIWVHPVGVVAAVRQLNTSACVMLPPKHGAYPPGPLQAPTAESKYTYSVDDVLVDGESVEIGVTR